MRATFTQLSKGQLLRLNLSYFQQSSSEKTEQPTAKKKQKARDEGQVAKSQDVSTAAMLLAGFFALSLFAAGMLSGILALFYYGFGMISLAHTNINPTYLANHVAWGLGQVILITVPMFVVSMAVGLFINIRQVGWKVTWKPLRPKFSKLNPLKGFKRIISLQSLVTFIKSMVKLGAVGTAVFIILSGEMDFIPTILDSSFNEVLLYIGSLVIRIGLTIGVLYAFIAIGDYAFTRWKHNKDLKMTKQEVKDEWKQAEGNPEIKSKIKQKMREISMRRMMQNVPEADVVITNPTHYAVALKYDLVGLTGAPVLVAKGVDYMAKRIRESGAEHNVPIVENPPLARAIYDTVELEQEIPEELYVAVAEIMAYVFKLRNEKMGIAA